jgi:hypothetical protein
MRITTGTVVKSKNKNIKNIGFDQKNKVHSSKNKNIKI